nr:rod-binding protein [Isachenkonia alkalipeptolytica]
MMFKNMRNTVPDGGLVEKSFGRGIYEEMQDEKMAEDISQNGGVGLAKELYQQLSQQHGYDDAAASVQETSPLEGDRKANKDQE